ncbi:DedA family protein [Paenibacillus aurantius]|uniref:DedA family protein n=2 Tax=Paenibacillus aurantius TaxID=2918900 RepID=A0AA96LIA6_9BACL|nr:DedA family protein [Paenibacillus aurantius]WNQ14331.1 DedA family protein [Paenibacillus aurantius]
MKLLDMLEHMFEQYGYLVLLFGLPLDFIASPIPPGNSTLTYTGYLAYKGVLDGLCAFVLALAGSWLGVTITYLAGYKLGMPLIEKYGRWLSIKPSFVEKTRRYYDKYGDNLLLIAFFLPGVRQFIGYFIGILRIPFKTVLMYAYTGTFLWVTAFFSIGYGFGDRWQQVFLLVERYLKTIFIGLAIILAAFLLAKWIGRGRLRS